MSHSSVKLLNSNSCFRFVFSLLVWLFGCAPFLSVVSGLHFYNYFTKCNRQELSHIKGGGSPACWCLLFCCLTLFITVFNLPFGRVSEYKDPGFHVTPPNAKPIYLLHNSNIQNSNLYFETIGRFLISKDVRQEEI